MVSEAEYRPKQVVCLVFCQADKILLEQRLDKDAFRENWMFTGGKVETEDEAADNPIHAASVREAKEETGLEVIKIERFSSFLQRLRDGRQFEFVGVYVSEWSGNLRNQEPRRRHLAWVAIAAAQIMIGQHEVDARILQDFLSYRIHLEEKP
jgi:8-oxo-dGTP pyrophosphatase MutT (NUDIX family)